MATHSRSPRFDENGREPGLLQNCADELTEGPYVQRPEELSAHPDRFSQIQGLMERFLDNVEEELGLAQDAS